MNAPNLSRRAFLQASAATSLLPSVPVLALPAHTPDAPWPENGTLIPDEGWTLWADRHAEWKNDPIYLPEDVRPSGPGDLATLPVHPPTGGWDVLTPTQPEAIPVTHPGTVEQHFWGQFGAGDNGKPRPYTPEEYRYAADDPIPQNGAFFGVSWWHRNIDIPAATHGKRIFLHIRGARLRAEVYLNRKLVGYSIMEELPFECDLTHAAQPGAANHLAIRITNPFGRFDWVDGLNAQWGAVKLYRSHGFGGLDRGMTISAHDGPRIKDAWMLNAREPRKAEVHLVVEYPASEFRGFVSCQLTDPITGFEIALGGWVVERRNTGRCNAELANTEPAGDVCWIQSGGEPGAYLFHALATVSVSKAVLWDLKSPKLYSLQIEVIKEHPNLQRDVRTLLVGFRTYAPEGVGTNALFRLNGRRIKLYSSISWGFWGLNGMWPTPELAEKEVTQAKKLNLNCLNFHRNLAKEEILRNHDRLGLLRYMEPGAGKMAIGKLPSGAQANSANIVMEKPTGAADKFAQRYMFVKCVEMVKAFRSHTSVIQYTLQNEIGADLNNPDTIAILEAMRAEDPSRCIVLNDGFVAPPRRAAQAWFEPWNPKLHRSDQEEWGGWWNQHQGAGDQWYDEFYKSPTDFTYRSPEHKALSEFGEMEGCATTPDNHSLMLHQHASPAGTGIGAQPANKSYDHVDHEEIDAAYNKFLDRWNFRAAFPSTESLYKSLGQKCYDTWQNYLENARISDDLDFAVISGWESTAIENHSGIVDNLRNFKSDPTPIAATLQPIRPIAKQRSLCYSFTEDALFDIFLLNDTGRPVDGELIFSVVDPKGNRTQIDRFHVPPQSPDQFSYLVKEEVRFRPKRNATVPYGFEGVYRFRLELTSHPLATQTKDIWFTFTQLKILVGEFRIAVSGISTALRKQLSAVSGPEVVDFHPGEKYDLIISAGLTTSAVATQESGDTTGLEAQPAAKPGEAPTAPHLGHLDPAILAAVRAGTPLLAIPQTDALSEGVAKQLAQAGAFIYNGTVGDFRAPWMGNWYFVRKHPVFAGMPINQCMGIHYQARGRQSNGLLVEGPNVEIVVGYSRDHDRNIGAGTFTTRLNSTKILYHRVPELHPVLQQRFLANAIAWLTT
jgi:beta-galactosidase